VKQYALPDLEALFIAGERCDPDTISFYQGLLGVNAYDNWWQTESGWPICGFQTPGIGMKPGSTSKPMPGYQVKCVTMEGGIGSGGAVAELPAGEEGDSR
jgi:propionyl-CoA synthetase